MHRIMGRGATTYALLWALVGLGCSEPGPDTDARAALPAAQVVGRQVASPPLLLSQAVAPDAPVRGFNAWMTRREPAVASDGTSALLVWSEQRPKKGNGNDTDIYGIRVDAAGRFVEQAPFPISQGPRAESLPSVAFDGTHYLVVWEDARGSTRDIYGARVTREGAVLDREGIAISAAPLDQRDPGVSAVEGRFLVAWSDQRGSLSTRPSQEVGIYATRVTSEGTVSDPNGLIVAPGPYGKATVTLSADARNFLVLWVAPGQVQAARVDAEGSVLDRSPLTLGGEGLHPEAFPAAAASDGRSFLVAWSRFIPGTACDPDPRDQLLPCERVVGARLLSDGTVSEAERDLSTASTGHTYAPSVLFNGTGFQLFWEQGRRWDGGASIWTRGVGDASTPMRVSSTRFPSQRRPVATRMGPQGFVAWSAGNSVSGARVNSDGTVLDPEDLHVMGVNDQFNPTVAFGDSQYFAAWTDNRLGDVGVYGARLGPTGAPLEGSAVRIATAPPGTYGQRAFVASNGQNALVVWVQAEGVRAARMSRTGALLDATPIAIAPITQEPPTFPSVASDGTSYLVVWADLRGLRRDIFGARVSASGEVLDPEGFLISRAPAQPEWPSVSFQDGQYLVVWQDYRRMDPTRSVYGSRVTVGGEVLDPEGIPLGVGRGVRDHPISAFGAGVSLVVWKSELGVQGVRVRSDGSVLDPQPLVISTDPSPVTPPAVTFDGARFLVLWRRQELATSEQVVVGARVLPDGTLLDPSGLRIADEGGFQTTPFLASAGDGTALAVYMQFDGTPDIGSLRVRGRFLSEETCVVPPCRGAEDAGIPPPVNTPPDGGTSPDAGIPPDGGTPPDAGEPADGGTPPEPEPSEPGKCGCGASPAGVLPLALVLLAARGRSRQKV